MLLLFSYISYLLAPNSNTSFTVQYPWICFFLYPIFLFFILKHVLYLFGQIRINPPFPPGKYTIMTCFLNENLDIGKLKQTITSKIMNDDRFKSLKRSIKQNLFISYSCPATEFFIEKHIQIIEEPFEKDVTLYQFIELNLMGLFEQSENEPKWAIYLIKNEKNPVLVFKFLAEYGFSYEFLLKILVESPFRLKNTVKSKELDKEWSLTKNLLLMKRIMDIRPKDEVVGAENNIFQFLKGMFQGKSNSEQIIKKQVLLTQMPLEEILQNSKIWNEDHGFLNEKEVDFMFDVFKLAGLFIPHALMVKAFQSLERKYQRMGYLNTMEFYKEIPGLIRRMFVINWKEQLFSVGLSSQIYSGMPAVVLIKNENLKKNNKFT